MVFSNNQVQHFYVGTDVTAYDLATQKYAHVTNSSNDGVMAAFKDKEGRFYLEQKGAVDVVTTDLIDPKQILSAKAVKGSSMDRHLKGTKITLDTSFFPLSATSHVVANEVYGLIVNIDSPYTQMHYYKDAHVLGKANMTDSDFYKEMALQLSANLDSDPVKMVGVALITTAGGTDSYTDVTMATTKASLSGTYTGILVKEVEQSWRKGVKESRPVQWTIQADMITYLGTEYNWFTTTDVSSSMTTIHNGKKIADLEWYCMGNRGDEYRQFGYPDTIDTEYMVNPSNTYSVIEIHYAFVGANDSVQKSEKLLTIAVPDGAAGSVYTKINAIIGMINTIAGTSIGTLS